MDKDAILYDEELLIIDGGEMPEVAFHSSLHYLTKDPYGPHIPVNSADLLRLKKAVVQGYRNIILRDISPDNRDKGLYRGLNRCCINWQRLRQFCLREHLGLEKERCEIGLVLKKFMSKEVAEVLKGQRLSSINCAPDDIHCLCQNLNLDVTEFPEGWQEICKCEVKGER